MTHPPVTHPDDLPAIPQAGLPVPWRRRLVLALNAATLAALGLLVWRILQAGGIDAAEGVILAGFLLATPWTVLGFWNAVIGLVLLHGPGDPARSVYPFYDTRREGVPKALATRTALLFLLRNEDPGPAFARMEAMRDSLRATGLHAHFRLFVLSDTSDPAIAAAEERAFARLSARGEGAPVYRRRAANTGFKAGNIRDFLDRHGEGLDFFLPLDSDSVMAGEVVLRLVAAMEAHPRIGILQTLVVGMPSDSAFARMFQFGMRHGMRAFTMGSTWWNADCGAYWGHNALIRTAPFRAHCTLPVLPGGPPLGGHILSHDQLEAAFLRHAGFEVRVLPVETASFEMNPPTILDFAKRDLRWCQGNMQFWRFLFDPRLVLLSRLQLLQAILMYVVPAGWIAMTLAATWKGAFGSFDPVPLRLGLGLFLAIFLLSASPKIAGVLDVLLTRGALRRYGGGWRFGLSAVIELVAGMLLAPIVAVWVSVFLGGLVFGRSVAWGGQNRDRLGVTWRAAALAMAPQTALGLALVAVVLGQVGWSGLVWIAPFVTGLCLAAPFAVATAAPALGRAVSRLGLFAVPEEVRLPPVLRGLVPDAARRWRRPAGPPRAPLPAPDGDD